MLIRICGSILRDKGRLLPILVVKQVLPLLKDLHPCLLG